MKSLILFASVFIALALVNGQGFPTKKCPSGEHSVLYCPQKAEPSCDNPTVHDQPAGQVGPCDVPQCFCNEPTVRNLKTGECMALEDCC